MVSWAIQLLLLPTNANLHKVINSGSTALHYAALDGRARVADVLLQANASTPP